MKTDQPDTFFDAAGLVAYLREQPDIAAAYLFGSQAEGRARSRSDVDIAVLLDEARLAADESVFRRRLQLMAELERFAACALDVVTLNDAPPLLCHQVLLHGRLLYEGNREQRIDFEVRTGKIYNDLEPMYVYFEEALHRELQGPGFGGHR